MRVIVQDNIGNRTFLGYEGEAGFTIGRKTDCQLRLPSPFISREHARVDRDGDGWFLSVSEGARSLTVDGQEVEPGETARLDGVVQAELLGQFILTFDDETAESGHTGINEQQITELQGAIHASVLRRLDLRTATVVRSTPSRDELEALNQILDELVHGEFADRLFHSELSGALLRQALLRRLRDRVFQRRAQDTHFAYFGYNPTLEETVEETVGELVKRLGLESGEVPESEAERAISDRFEACAQPLINELLDNVRTYLITRLIKKWLYDTIFGYGPLQDLLDDAAVSEIMVVHPGLIYVERSGRMMRSDRSFVSDEATVSVIERIVAPLGRRIDRSQPLVDARLPDGSRVNAVIPPLAIKGPCITIRKFPQRRVTIEDLRRLGSLTDSAIALLDACVRSGYNTVVVGGTGSGKTTLLNALSGMIPPWERLVTIEDSAELQLEQEHVVTLETRSAGTEGTGAYTIRDLVRNALRMRPDRIIVGECRGQEAIDMLQAMNTGHDGSMTTLHANSASDVVARLETMVLLGADIPLPAVRRQIADAIHLIVFTEQLSDGRRQVTEIAEVLGLNRRNEIEIRDIMRARPSGRRELRATGYMPSFMERLIQDGSLDLEAWLQEVQT